MQKDLLIGLDIGSTTVKAVVITRDEKTLLWNDYQRHETRQREKTLELLRRIEHELSYNPKRYAVFVTGSGGSDIAPLIGAKFIQEVNAVVLAVRARNPDARSVVELGGQDAKIIIFKQDPHTGSLTSHPSMNDKCAAGTGATIEKIAKKIGLSMATLATASYYPHAQALVNIAAKCGVFAETDVVGHLKAGVPEEQILASLFDAIVTQNLAVLTRGHTLLPKVLLLGGPNTYINGMVEAWQYHIHKLWQERQVILAKNATIEALITVPPYSQYYAAFGAIEHALKEGDETINAAAYQGTATLAQQLQHHPRHNNKPNAGNALWRNRDELHHYLKQYTPKPFRPIVLSRGSNVETFLGIDSGSTSTKAVLTDIKGNVIAKSYHLSNGNPIQEVIACIADLERHAQHCGAKLHINGVATTGYAKEVIADIIGADTRLVETVAHTLSARHLYSNVDVIVDIGGQDIKLIMLKDGRVSDFRLNSQCSAGNGYFLQNTAQAFNIDIKHYAATAFEAQAMPVFGYGCAVFLQSDIINFQKEGWTKQEILAGLAAVLPKNIWLYVSKIPNLSTLGSTFVLQGGTQYNLAAVKAQIDFIEHKFIGTDTVPRIIVHEHCGEAGAMGAALEALRLYRNGQPSQFIGLKRLKRIQYRNTRNEHTRCHFCANQCLRTFTDISTDIKVDIKPSPVKASHITPHPSKLTLAPGHERIISGFSCERGSVENINVMRVIKHNMDQTLKATPNTVAEMQCQAFKATPVIAAMPELAGIKRLFAKRIIKNTLKNRDYRKNLTIGIPKVLNLYSLAPFFMAYFQSLGISPRNIRFSNTTSQQLYKKGIKRGAIDPCFPSKLAIAHLHDLLTRVHAKKPLNCIFFPMIDSFPGPLTQVSARCACPTVTATPEAVKAAYTAETNLFAKHNISYVNPLLNLDNRPLLRQQLFQALQHLLKLNRYENDLAVSEGLKQLEVFDKQFRQRGQEIIDQLEREQQFGFVVLARPYHNDPGVNHGILQQLQQLGYPIIAQDALPNNATFLKKIFGPELAQTPQTGPMAINDVWPTAYSENTSRKIWAAKIAARHPNLVAIELSSFKCGHDAPAYTVIERILAATKTPFFTFRDLDENSPDASIKLRIETIDYFLKREKNTLLCTRNPDFSEIFSTQKKHNNHLQQ